MKKLFFAVIVLASLSAIVFADDPYEVKDRNGVTCFDTDGKSNGDDIFTAGKVSLTDKNGRTIFSTQDYCTSETTGVFYSCQFRRGRVSGRPQFTACPVGTKCSGGACAKPVVAPTCNIALSKSTVTQGATDSFTATVSWTGGSKEITTVSCDQPAGNAGITGNIVCGLDTLGALSPCVGTCEFYGLQTPGRHEVRARTAGATCSATYTVTPAAPKSSCQIDNLVSLGRSDAGEKFRVTAHYTGAKVVKINCGKGEGSNAAECNPENNACTTTCNYEKRGTYSLIAVNADGAACEFGGTIGTLGRTCTVDVKSCVDESTSALYKCVNGAVEEKPYVTLPCAPNTHQCQNGVCVPRTTCREIDVSTIEVNGKTQLRRHCVENQNNRIAGYYACKGNELITQTTLRCAETHVCEEGACVPLPTAPSGCVDADNSNANYDESLTVKANCTDGSGRYTDYTASATQGFVNEYYCGPGADRITKCLSGVDNCLAKGFTGVNDGACTRCAVTTDCKEPNTRCEATTGKCVKATAPPTIPVLPIDGAKCKIEAAATGVATQIKFTVTYSNNAPTSLTVRCDDKYAAAARNANGQGVHTCVFSGSGEHEFQAFTTDGNCLKKVIIPFSPTGGVVANGPLEGMVARILDAMLSRLGA